MPLADLGWFAVGEEKLAPHSATGQRSLRNEAIFLGIWGVGSGRDDARMEPRDLPDTRLSAGRLNPSPAWKSCCFLLSSLWELTVLQKGVGFPSKFPHKSQSGSGLDISEGPKEREEGDPILLICRQLCSVGLFPRQTLHSEDPDVHAGLGVGEVKAPFPDPRRGSAA